MEKINLFINGKAVHSPPGTSVLDAATANGVKIPTLCHHPHLKPTGACRLCMVEEEKSGRVFASCVTPVSPDMAILTHTPVLHKYRTDIIRLMMANHPESCILCNQGNRCKLRQIAADLDVGSIGLYPMPHYTGLEAANPFITRDLSKCILCGKCIRADHELVMVGAIDYNQRGFQSRPSAVHGLSLEKSSCTFCGTCVSLCPTGALITKNARYVGSPQKESSTVCGFCGVGCTLVMGTVDGQVVEVNPSHESGTVNLSTLCVRGHFEYDFLASPDRLSHPLIRNDNNLSPVFWDEALEYVRERLMTIKKENGPQSLGFIGSSKCTNEENYLFQKLARTCFKTNNIDNGAYVWGRSAIRQCHERLDGGNRITPIQDLEKAELIFVLGADPIHSAPVLGYALKRAARANRVPLIVVDPRKTGLVPFASLWLPINTQTDCELINALAAVLFQHKAYNRDFIQQYTEGFDQYSDRLDRIDLDRMARITGIDKGLIEKAASMMNGRRIVFVVGHGLLQQRNSLVAMDALINLALMTGNMGGNSSGIYILSKENNQMGAMDMGSLPDYLPGGQPLRDALIRRHWERNWDITLSPDPGLNMVRMIEEAEKGNLKALYIMGENPLRSLPQPERVKKALEKLEFLVVQDILSTETAKIADVVLPGAAFSEKGGSFTNMEGRIQYFEPVIHPPGDARSDWMILDILLERSANSRRYESLQKIQEEIRQLVPMYKDLDSRTETSWVRENSRMRLFCGNGEGRLIPFSHVTAIETESFDMAYPIKAILGSERYHLGSGTRTGFSARMKDFTLKGEVGIAPDDAKRLNLKDGDEVKISSSHGVIHREIKLDKGLKQRFIFIPVAFNDNDVMKLINLSVPGISGSPGWNTCDVKIERTGEK